MKVGLHIFISFFIIASMQLGTYLQDGLLGSRRYAFQLGHGLGPYRIFVQNDFMQFSLKNTLRILPYSTQYIIYIAEDASRVFKINNDFKDKNYRRQFCKENDLYICFKTIVLTTNQKAAFNCTGGILLTAVGAKIILSEKKKDEIRSHFESSLRIIELSQIINKSLHNESRVENIIPGFPVKDFNKISNADRIKLDSMNVEKKLHFGDFIFGINVPGKDSNNKDSILQAYLLKKTEDQIINKFDSAIKEKIKAIEAKIVAQLSNEAKTKGLTKEEITAYKARIRELAL